MGERSLNRTSTPSRLIFVHPPPVPPPPLSSLPPHFALNHTQSLGNEPLPSLEGCGLKSKLYSSLGNPDPLHPPLPSPEGCGQLSRSTKDFGMDKLGWTNTRGEIGSEAATTKTRNNDFHRLQPRTSTHTHPSPFQRDVGEFFHARRRVMGGRIPGGTREVGIPASASRKRTR